MPSLSNDFLHALQIEAARCGVSVEALREMLASASPSPEQRFFENAPDPMLILDKSVNLIAFNSAYANLIDCEPSDLANADHRRFVHPDDLSLLRAALIRLRHGEDPPPFTVRLRRADGDYLWLEWQIGQRDDYYYCTGRDISRQHRLERDLEDVSHTRRSVEADLRRRTREFYTVVQNNPDPISRFDRNLRYIFVNQANADASGVPLEQMLGSTLGDLGAPQDLRDRLESAIEHVFATGEFMRLFFDFTGIKGYKHFDARLAPELNDEGEIESVLMVSRDITAQRQLELQLRERETWYRGIVESQVDLVSRYTRDLTLVFVNDAYCRYYGGTREDFIGHSILALEDPKVHATLLAHIEKMVHDPAPQVNEILSYWPDGRERWIQWVTCAVTMSSTGATLFQAVGRDITAQRQLERQLRESETWYRGIVESQVDLVSRHLPDSTIIFVNDAYCKYYGMPREELIGRSFLITEPEAVHEELLEQLRFTMSSPGPHIEENLSYHADGRPRWVQWMSYGFADETGKVTMIQAVGRDITQQKLAEQTRRENEERFRAMLEAASEGIALIDAQDTLVVVNRYIEERFGYKAAQLTDGPFDLLFEKESHAVIRAALERARATGINIRVNPTPPPLARSSANRPFPVEITFAPLMLSGHSMTLLLLVDITERQELEEQRLINRALEVELEKERELIDLKQRFTTMVTHEFRTPLAVIQSTVDIVRNYLNRLPAEKLAERLDIVTKQTRRMGELLTDVLTFNRGERGLKPSSLETIDMAEFCRGIIEDLQMVDDDGHPILLEILNPPVTIHTDQRLLEHICQNLIGNAIKYSPLASPVEITLNRVEETIVLTVADHGIGIPEIDLSRIYTPFHRAANVGSRSGSGLGLPIVKQCVEALHGTIEVKSLIGSGTIFTVRLPRSTVLD